MNRQQKYIGDQTGNQLASVLAEQLRLYKEETREEALKVAIAKVTELLDNVENTVKLLENENKTMGISLREATDKINEQGKIVSTLKGLTSSFMMNPSEKRKFDRYVSSLTYNHTKKDSVCDRLFHGSITRACKRHIVESLDVNGVNYIQVDDLETTKVLAKAFMKPHTIKNIIKRRLGTLNTKNNSKAGLKPEVKALFDAYLEETNGGVDISVGF